MNQAVILAGGRGVRLRERLRDLPKPMIPIGGKPLLEHQIDLLRACGFREILLLVGHGAEVIRNHFGEGTPWGVRLHHLEEARPLGTAGAVLRAFPHLAERFLVLYGDVMLNVDLEHFWRAHETANADATLLLHPNDHPYDSDLVEVDEQGWIRVFHRRPHAPEACFQNLVNAALYVVQTQSLQRWVGTETPLDFAEDLFPAMLERGGRLHGYRSFEYIKDIGTPARYDRVCAEYAAGVVKRGSRKRPQAAVFLDRDGTLNYEVGGVTTPEELTLFPDAGRAVQRLNSAGMRVVIVTNQPVLAKGRCDEGGLRRIHDKLESCLGRAHAFVDRTYVCPHHPDRGFPEERRDLKVDCDCRKPRTGMIEQAVKDLGIDLGESWLVGDTTTDVETAKRAGVRSVLVRTGHGGTDHKFNVRADYVADNLDAAADLILKGRNPEP